MIRKLLATTAMTAFVAGGAFAQVQAEHEITVSAGDTVIIEAEREEAEINLRLHSGAAGAQQQTPEGTQHTGTADPEQAQQQQQAGAVDRGQFQATDLQQVSADELIGTDVYSAQDENIGSIGDVLLTQDGAVDAIVVDVGGFLGMGAHEVALGMDDIDLMTDDQGNLYAYTPYTQEQLEGSPEYDQATWTEQRDDQRMTGDMAAQMQPAEQQAQQDQDQQMAQGQQGMAGEHVVADGGTVFVQSDQQNFQLSFEIRLAGQDQAQVGTAADGQMDEQAQAEPGVDQ